MMDTTSEYTHADTHTHMQTHTQVDPLLSVCSCLSQDHATLPGKILGDIGSMFDDLADQLDAMLD